MSDSPPVAVQKPHVVPSPNGGRADPYYWLRDDTRKDSEMLAYLEAENRYKDALLAPLRQSEEELYQEIVSRIAADDSTVPFLERGYYYYQRFEKSMQYPLHARRKGSTEAPEQVLLDVNALAEGHDFYSVGTRRVSADNRLLAYAEDTTGRRKYTVRIKNLETSETLPDALPMTNGSVVWADDNRTLFYVERDETTLLGVRVKKHVLGTDPARDPVVYEETDHSFYMRLGTTGDRKYLVLHLSSTISDEVRVLPADKPNGQFRVLIAREPNHEFSVDHIGERWIVRTNWQAKNFRLVEAKDGEMENRARWRELQAHDENVLVEDFHLFEDYYVVGERGDALKRLRVRSWDGRTDYLVQVDETAYALELDVNREQATHKLRYGYDSLTTPHTIYELDMKNQDRRLLKRQPVPGYDPSVYQSERLWATARDGERIPVSLAYRKGFKKDGTAPMYQYGYGSYGHSMDPAFRSTVVSLLDRGFVFAIAHIRGGQEMGRRWYEQGRQLHKRNTFTDFIDATEFLVKERVADPQRVAASGGSAGGLLVGAVANMRPDLYRAIVARVPFVDVVTTMLDESIPLTTNEFDEWGNPKDKRYYDYMLSYSPYDNIRAQDYPAIFVSTGLWDSQVQYYEPAKWVAKLRATKTDDNPILFHINMDAGHGGKSGRYRRQRETATEYAFLLSLMGG